MVKTNVSFSEKLLFASLVYTCIFVNFDGGALPPILDLLKDSLGIPPAQQGLLGGMAYIGLTVACPLAGPVLQRVPTRLILIVSITLNSFFCFLFGLAPSRVYAFLARFGVGFTHSIIVVYNPVWVDCHAPRSYATTWLSFIQASAPLGIMIGYCVSGYLSQVFHVSWRLAFYIQGVALIPPLLVFLFAPTSALSISDEEDDDPDFDQKMDVNMLQQTTRSDDGPPAPARARAGSTMAAMVIVRSISRMAKLRCQPIKKSWQWRCSRRHTPMAHMLLLNPP